MSTRNKFIEIMDNDGDVFNIRKSTINVVVVYNHEVKIQLSRESSWVHTALQEEDVPKLLEELNND